MERDKGSTWTTQDPRWTKDHDCLSPPSAALQLCLHRKDVKRLLSQLWSVSESHLPSSSTADCDHKWQYQHFLLLAWMSWLSAESGNTRLLFPAAFRKRAVPKTLYYKKKKKAKKRKKKTPKQKQNKPTTNWNWVPQTDIKGSRITVNLFILYFCNLCYWNLN